MTHEQTPYMTVNRKQQTPKQAKLETLALRVGQYGSPSWAAGLVVGRGGQGSGLTFTSS